MTQTDLILLIVVGALAALAAIWLFSRSTADSDRASKRIPGYMLPPQAPHRGEAVQHKTLCPPPTEPECATGKLVGPRFEQYTIRVRTTGACGGCNGDEVGARLQRMANMMADAAEARADEQFREDLLAMLGGKPPTTKAKAP